MPRKEVTGVFTLHNVQYVVLGDAYEPSDDSYMLANYIEKALPKRLGGRGCRLAIDVGCGSGILTIELCSVCREVIALDLSPDAVASTIANLKKSDAPCLYAVVQGDGLSPLSYVKADLVVFNPPYLPVRDEGWAGIAWSGGEDGVEVFLEVASCVPRILRRGGVFVFVLSSMGDVDKAVRRLTRMGFVVRVVDRKKFFFEELLLLEAVYDAKGGAGRA